MKASLKRRCPDTESIHNASTNIIDELLPLFEENKHLVKQLKSLKSKRLSLIELTCNLLEQIVTLEHEKQGFKLAEDQLVASIEQDRKPEKAVEAAAVAVRDELKSKDLTVVLGKETNALAGSCDIDTDIVELFPQFYECLKTVVPNTLKLFEELLPGDNVSNLTNPKCNMALFMMIASLLSSWFPWWKSKFTYLVQMEIMNSANVPGAAKTTSQLLPGAMSYGTQRGQMMVRNLSSMKKDPVFDFQNNLVVFSYDNIQTKQAKTTEATAGAKSKSGTVKVSTFRIALLFKNPKWAVLQTSYDHNPAQMSSKYPLKDVPDNCMELDATEQHYIDAEYTYAVLFALELVYLENTWKDERRGNAVSAAKATDALNKKCQKQCTGCDAYNFNIHGFCRECGNALPTMTAIQAREVKSEVPLINQHVTFRLRSKEERAAGHQFLSAAPSYATFYPKTTMIETTMPGATIETTAAQEGSVIQTVDCERVVLPMLPGENPGLHEVERKIQRDLLALVGFSIPGGAKQVGLVTDAGAIDVKELLKDSISDFWYQIGHGHSEMAITRLMMRCTIAVLGDKFVYAHKFKEGTGGPEYLKSCKSNHKAWAFVQLCGIALNKELVKQFLLSYFAAGNSSLEGNLGDIAEQFRLFLESKDAKSDLMFQNAVFLSRLIAAAACFRKALRSNKGCGNPDAIDAAFKTVLPLFYMFGFNKYGPLIHWSLIRTNFRVTPEVKDMFRGTQATNGQGLDYHVEEDIQRVMRGAQQKTTISGLVASVEQLRHRSRREMVRSAMGLKTASPDRTWRRGVNREADLAAMGEVFCEFDTLKIVPGRRKITSIDRLYVWVAGVTLSKVNEEGKKFVVHNKQSGFQLSMPKPTKLLSNVAEIGDNGQSIDDFDEEEIEEAELQEDAVHTTAIDGDDDDESDSDSESVLGISGDNTVFPSAADATV
jgi:hypothetical protein